MSIGTSGSVSQEFVDLLTAEMLLAPDAQFVFASMANAARAGALDLLGVSGESGLMANIEAAMGKGVGTIDRMAASGSGFAKVVLDPSQPGKTILIDRPVYLDGTFTEVSRRLSETVTIDTSAPLSPTFAQVPLTVREYGGPYDNTNTRVAPVGITDFLKRRAKHNMIAYVGMLLRRDRNAFVDRTIVDMLLTTTNQTTPGDVATASMTAGGNPLTEACLAEVKRKLLERGIPPFANGNYMLVLSPKHEENLRADSAFREVTRYLGVNGGGPMLSGYLITYGGFDICISARIPTVGVGSGGAVTGNQAVAFGPEAIGHGIGMDVEARRYANDDFGRMELFVWEAHEAWGLLNAALVEKIVTS